MTTSFTKSQIITLLASEGIEEQQLLNQALHTKLQYLDNAVHLRGLIEYSSCCHKNCLYCGLRVSNSKASRYTMSDHDVLDCARQALELHFGSIAIQCGERSDADFTRGITRLVRAIKDMSEGKLGITLSCGEQTPEVYREWFEAGAHRYLLRIESSNEELYYKIHPKNATHDFQHRIDCIKSLLSIGYQTGTGVMVGLPFQTLDILADDLLFFRNLNVAMVGMGPFVPHPETPLWVYRDQIPHAEQRLRLTLKMIAVLRLMMPQINMVSATANLTIDPDGRNRAILAGANVIMPNMTPTTQRKEYTIYPDKPNVQDSARDAAAHLETEMESIGHRVLYDAWGDSQAFLNKKNSFLGNE